MVRRKTSKSIEVKKLSGTQLAVLQSFFPRGKDITLKEIMNKSGYSYEPVYRTLQGLIKDRLISVKNYGRTLVYLLDPKKELSRIAFYLYAKERLSKFKERHFGMTSALSGLPEDKIDFLAIFGSYAKGNERKNSDIDTICVTSDAEELKAEISSLKTSHNINFSSLVISKGEFSKIRLENKEFWHDLVEYGIIFKGYELLYFYAYLAE